MTKLRADDIKRKLLGIWGKAPDPELTSRDQLSQWLEGTGIEIGALHNPLPSHTRMHVRYVDALSTEQLRAKYPELAPNIVNVDIISNAHALTGIENLSQDFVVANHLIEHMSNPLRAIQTWVCKLKVGGILYVALPKCDRTFDKYRPVTAWKHFLWDYRNDSNPVKAEKDIVHIEEMLSSMNKSGVLKNFTDKDIPVHARKLCEQQDVGVHFHTWDSRSGPKFFSSVARLFGCKIFKQANLPDEMIFLLQKTAHQAAGSR